MKILSDILLWTVGALLGILIGLLLVNSVKADESVPAANAELPILQHAIPATQPSVVMATSQCNHLIAIVAVMPDGSVIGFDKRSRVNYKAQVEWALSAAHVYTVDAPCRLDPGVVGKDL